MTELSVKAKLAILKLQRLKGIDQAEGNVYIITCPLFLLGLLKFCTFGFMFLGQLIDIILIAAQVWFIVNLKSADLNLVIWV